MSFDGDMLTALEADLATVHTMTGKVYRGRRGQRVQRLDDEILVLPGRVRDENKGGGQQLQVHEVRVVHRVKAVSEPSGTGAAKHNSALAKAEVTRARYSGTRTGLSGVTGFVACTAEIESVDQDPTDPEVLEAVVLLGVASLGV